MRRQTLFLVPPPLSVMVFISMPLSFRVFNPSLKEKATPSIIARMKCRRFWFSDCPMKALFSSLLKYGVRSPARKGR